jgi:hypothetical protein
MRRRTVIYALVAVALPALAISWCAARDNRLEANFGRLMPGMSAEDVIRVMGRPSWDGPCGAKMPAGMPNGCAREIGYAVSLAPIVPSYYLIWFAKDGRVVETAPISSP